MLFLINNNRWQQIVFERCRSYGSRLIWTGRRHRSFHQSVSAAFWLLFSSSCLSVRHPALIYSANSSNLRCMHWWTNERVQPTCIGFCIIRQGRRHRNRLQFSAERRPIHPDLIVKATINSGVLSPYFSFRMFNCTYFIKFETPRISLYNISPSITTSQG